MDEKDYVKTLVVGGKEIKLGLDDCGQCYYIEWEQDGETKETCLGTYNFHYMEDIFHLFDDDYRNLSRKWLWSEDMTSDEQANWNEYQRIIEEEYGSIIEEEEADVR